MCTSDWVRTVHVANDRETVELLKKKNTNYSAVLFNPCCFKATLTIHSHGV